MIDLLILLHRFFASWFKSKVRLEAENLMLRHQVNILRRRAPRRLRLRNLDRLILVAIYRLVPTAIDALAIVKPATVIRLHRLGFRAYWRWKSRLKGGRPRISAETRQLIRQMSLENPLWGAPRIHGELLKLAIDVGQTSVAKYMARWRQPPSQGWKTFLRNHAAGIASIDLFIVPTLSFRLLYGFLMLGHRRRQILSIGVTTQPTAEWLARQVTEACCWDRAPDYVIRDRDCAYGDVFVRRMRAMGIRDRPIAPRSPWQNAYVERLIGSIRRECLDHIVVFNERHLCGILEAYKNYYNCVRPHLSLNKDAPEVRPIQMIGQIVPLPIIGGLHHHYVRI